MKQVWISLGDAVSAKIAAECCDVILVGDSLAMTHYGLSSTREIPPDVLLFHTMAVVKAVPKDFPVVFDFPFLSQKNPEYIANALNHIGVSRIKIEGIDTENISFFRKKNFEVIGHIGLLPQSAETFSVRGREEKEAEKIFSAAKILEAKGISALVLECVPETLAEKIDQNLSIPVIGIGAGQKVSGQILVLSDICGRTEKIPRFSRKFADEFTEETRAIHAFSEAVKNGDFPKGKEIL